MPQFPKKPGSLEAAAPKIPGVPPPRPKKQIAGDVDAGPVWMRQPPYVWAAGGAAVLIFLIAIVWWFSGSKPPTQSPTIETSTASVAQPTPVSSVAKPPVAPGQIATTDELSRDWAAKKFYFRDPAGKTSPAMIVHLPDGAYWAFSLREPYGPCELEYITDLEKLRGDYNFSATYPMVGDSCTHTVFDLTKYGSGPSGVVRGDIVAGPGVRPPLAIELQINGTKILAVRSEADLLH
jgi:hypothetical protein